MPEMLVVSASRRNTIAGLEVETVAETWEWELLTGPATITEGPVWDGAGLLYTSIANNEIRRYDPATGQIVTVYYDTGGSNGLALGPDGALYACEGTGRAVVRHGPDRL